MADFSVKLLQTLKGVPEQKSSIQIPKLYDRIEKTTKIHKKNVNL